MHDFYLDVMRRSPAAIEPYYSRRFIDLQTDTGGSGGNAWPVTVRLERLDGAHQGQIETVQARYVVGCDGARSAVRKCIGRALHGDSANHAWGVMDVLAVTDFPDIRFKTLIRSAEHGSMLIIPREGGYLFRLYIELDELGSDERVSDRHITLDDLIAAARRIFVPYALDVKEVPWWSVYEIGQRLCDKFDDVPEADVAARLPRVFIAGDACHTHSPKAGQGMNVSMQDGFNLGWKLAAVLRRACSPRLLHTYSAERQAVASGADRLRSRMGRLAGIEQEGSIRLRPKDILSRTGATPRARQRTTARRSSPARQPGSISPKGCRSACGFIPRRSSAWRMRNLFTLATS